MNAPPHLESDPPELFADHIQLAITRYAVTIELYLTRTGASANDQPRLVGNVRLSKALAHDLGSNLLHQLKQPQGSAAKQSDGSEDVAGETPPVADHETDVVLDPGAHSRA